MKKVLILSIAVLSLFAVGCGKKKVNREAVLEEYARDYYGRYILDKVQGLDIPEISIEDLEKANKSGQTNYDLKKLDKCEKTSYARLLLNENGKDIDSVELKLNCK